MIVAEGGVRWGTAAEIAEHLGQGVTAAMIRRWADRDGLTSARIIGQHGRPEVRYPLLDAARIDTAKRRTKRGRTRAS